MSSFFSKAAQAAGIVVGMSAAMVSTSTWATEIERVVSPGGIEAWLVEERAIPIISIQASFAGGASRDSEAQQGRARLFAGLLEEGAGDYDAAAFAEEAEKIAARYSFGANKDSLSVGATMLAERRDESVELLRLALTAPRFDAEPVARVKAQLKSRIRQDEADPNSISGRAFMAAAFPQDAYGRASTGAIATLDALTAADLRAATPELLNRSTVKIGVVGAISAEELGPLLDHLFGELPSDKLPALEAVSPEFTGGVSVIPFEAPQSTVTFGHLGLRRHDPDFIPAYVMNYILGGGGFASRLTEEVRENRGLAYGVYSYLNPMDRSELYLGGVATQNERVAETIEVITQEWTRMAQEGVSEEELEKAKRYLTGAFALRFDSNGKIASFLVQSQQDGLEIDYIKKRNSLIEAVTTADIKRVAARALKPEDLFFVVVGKPEGLPQTEQGAPSEK